MHKRSSGIILHISSLPSKYGVGDFGKEAYRFVDFLDKSGQTLWQILPLYPTGNGFCPYQGTSSFAGNPLFIDIDMFVEKGILEKKDISNLLINDNTFDYRKVQKNKIKILKKVYACFLRNKGKDESEYNLFCKRNHFWIDDFSLFMALSEANKNLPWYKWDKPLKYRHKKEIQSASVTLNHEIDFHRFLQYVFSLQWTELKNYANKKGVKIIGDNPIYLSYESCDVWAHPELFMLASDRTPLSVSGVPPDYFSPTGQLWGHPLYNWKQHQKANFSWWIENMKSTLSMVDILRIDHFIGFVHFWMVSYGSRTAKCGKWKKAPGMELFTTLKSQLGDIEIIAEDLGYKTCEVDQLMKKMNFPGMKLLQEGVIGGCDHPFAPQNYKSSKCVVYTSTHDSEPLRAWFLNLNNANKKNVLHLLKCNTKEVAKKMIELAWSSKAIYAIAQMQDILELGGESRMNVPGTKKGNWQWRLKRNYIQDKTIQWLRDVTRQYKRL